MRLSSMADYAVVTMIAAASHCGGTPNYALEGRRLTLNAGLLARETGLPTPTVQKLVSRLVGAGLLHSARGIGGGLRLARPAAAISLADIVEAVEGPIALTTCSDKSGDDCALGACCSMRSHWPMVNEALRKALAEVSLSALAANGRPATPALPLSAGGDEMMEAMQ
ncbi:Rrf2 family transcriptional regulator [Novosphingobium sp. FSY-8]|uniref:Rrf2 family transcriptional regulator n=1 Tax=Novosphingobium ovatum TaxID=1908523 RepID=A0ABW9XEQ5_9SPHN|nr:Rrf2 family transcriptional regulator [Novosphingobium ovatum]NBC37012.1 Rrf2 family transcriptional regulator [Novosphingobium ovatum]